MRRSAAAILLIGLMATTGVAIAPPATAAVVTCGQVITQSIVLQNDVGPCPNNGLVVGADNITVNLNGRRVFGTGPAGDGAGVLFQGRTGSTVTNGVVSEFDAGVAVLGGGRNTIQAVTARNNVGAEGAIGGDGILIVQSRDNRILANVVHDNGPYSGIALIARTGPDHPVGGANPTTGNLVDNNRVFHNVVGRDRATTANNDNDGIRVENFAEGNTISNNEIRDNGLDGISLFADTANNVVRDNRVTANGFYRSTVRRGSGIIVFSRSTGNTVENNTVTGNADSGIDLRGPSGPSAGATNNTVRSNTSVGNAVLPTIPGTSFSGSYDLKDGNANCDNNTWFANRYRTFNQPCVTAGGQQV